MYSTEVIVAVPQMVALGGVETLKHPLRRGWVERLKSVQGVWYLVSPRTYAVCLEDRLTLVNHGAAIRPQGT